MSVIRRFARLIVVLAAVVGAAVVGIGLSNNARAQDVVSASDWVRTGEADVRLIAARTALDGREEIRLGLQYDLKPGWKVYWRSPGDAGYPPRIDWAGSSNLAGSEIAWPVPHRFALFGIQTAGYKDQVVLPITARVSDPSRPLRLKASVEYLICSDICIPGQAALALDLPPGDGAPSDAAHLIDRYMAQVPGPGRGITLTEAVLEPGSEAGATAPQSIAVTVAADPPLRAPDLFVEGPYDGGGRGIISDKPEVTLSADGRRAILRAPLLNAYAAGAVPELTITVADVDRGLETVQTPAVGPLQTADVGTAAAAVDGGAGLALILGLALIGGLILNLMPCVLPVLSLKVMGFLGHGGGDSRPVRLSFVASAAGIVFAFLVLATALAGLKAAGAAIGWGIQFQQPLFLTIMVVLLVLFAANLFGFYEVRLPGALADVGAGHGTPRSLAGHFATGAFATVLATPCSAPFLGTAVGFALSRGPLEIGLVFFMLGLGMSLPYLTIALFPGIATKLPRPGAWMVTVKKVLGFALLATAVWLLSVLQVQVGWTGVAVVAALMMVATALLWLRGRLQGPVPRRLAGLTVAVPMLAALAVPLVPALGTGPAAASRDTAVLKGVWRPFDRAAIAGTVAEGKVVFVDVTADWCITCKVNKAAVLERDPVATALQGAGVVAMQADWTQPDDGIADYLASFGRYGIPFNVVYGPGAPAGIALPELLTSDAVMDALRRAGG